MSACFLKDEDLEFGNGAEVRDGDVSGLASYVWRVLYISC